MTLALGVDVGGTNVRVAVVEAPGAIRAAARRRLTDKSPAAVVETVAELVAEAKQQAGVSNELPIGVGLAAQVHHVTGVVAVSPNHGWRDVPFGALLRERLGRPVRLVNDLNAIAAGEARAGAGRGADDVLCVFVGTGVGMGAIAGGRLLEGCDGLAAELGHIKVASPVDGRPCGCGMRGCLEAYTGGAQLGDLVAAEIAGGTPSRLLDELGGDLGRVDAAVVDAAAADGDPAATRVWEVAAAALCQGIGAAITLFNPRVLVLGGGVLRMAPGLVRRVRECLGRYVGEPYLRDLRIVESALGDDAGVIGAALTALDATPGSG